jgi:hypothetical protein
VRSLLPCSGIVFGFTAHSRRNGPHELVKWRLSCSQGEHSLMWRCELHCEPFCCLGFMPNPFGWVVQNG